MDTIPFDTHSYVKKLQAAGVSEAQAEVHAQALVELAGEHLATKHDIELIRRDMKEMESRIMIRLGGLVVAGFTLLAALMGLLIALIQM